MKRVALPLVFLAIVIGCNEEAKRQPPPAAPAAPAAPSPEPPVAAAAKALKNALTVDPVEAIARDGRVVIRAHLKNPTAAELRPVLSWEAQGTWWQGEKAVMAPVPPGGEGTIEVHAKIGERVYPLPRARLEVTDGRQKLCVWEFLDRAMAAVAPLVREWNVAGPFEAATLRKASGEADGGNLDIALRSLWDGLLPPEKGVDLAAVYPGRDGKSVHWKVLTAEPSGFVNLGESYQTPYSAAYAVAYVYSPEARSCRFSAGSTDGLRVRVNGKEVWTKNIVRAAAPDQDAFSADLKQGWNEVLVKVAHRTGEWGFYFRVIDPDRQLKFAPKPEAAAAK